MMGEWDTPNTQYGVSSLSPLYRTAKKIAFETFIMLMKFWEQGCGKIKKKWEKCIPWTLHALKIIKQGNSICNEQVLE